MTAVIALNSNLRDALVTRDEHPCQLHFQGCHLNFHHFLECQIRSNSSLRHSSIERRAQSSCDVRSHPTISERFRQAHCAEGALQQIAIFRNACSALSRRGHQSASTARGKAVVEDVPLRQEGIVKPCEHKEGTQVAGSITMPHQSCCMHTSYSCPGP